MADTGVRPVGGGRRFNSLVGFGQNTACVVDAAQLSVRQCLELLASGARRIIRLARLEPPEFLDVQSGPVEAPFGGDDQWLMINKHFNP
jgi:hypothetical protein